jgi:superfamily II DNA or RNA helicase
MSYLSNRGYVLIKENHDQRILNDIRKELTVSPFKPMETVKSPEYTIYQESKTKLYIPKAFGLSRFGGVCRDRTTPIIDLEFVGDLRTEQISAVDGLLAACNDPLKSGGILNVFCGGGKTTMALYVIAKLGLKAVIVVHKEFLLTQWLERIDQFLPTARVGLIKGKILDIENKDIILVSLQSISMKEYHKDTFMEFGTVVVDEVHHTSAEVFNRALFKLGLKYTIGLSATVTRKDGLSKVFMWHIGDIVYKSIKRIDTVDVQIHKYYSADPTYCEEHYVYGGKINYSKMLNQICFHPSRNILLIQILKNIAKDEKRKILVLGDRVKHLQMLKAEMHAFNCGIYTGGMKSGALKECESKQIIFATYAIASEGYDQKGLNTLVLASPRTDTVQSIGRILRDKECDRIFTPLIVDIVDDFGVFGQQGKKRRAYYKKQKYNCKEVFDL